MKDDENIINNRLLELNRRIGVVISLLLRMVPQEGSTTNLKEQVRILHDLGLRPRDIAEILGRTPTHINKELSAIRKEVGKRKQ